MRARRCRQRHASANAQRRARDEAERVEATRFTQRAAEAAYQAA